MAPAPDDRPDAPQGDGVLLITAAEWDALVTEDPQASPDWKVLPPYGAWHRRLPPAPGVPRLPGPTRGAVDAPAGNARAPADAAAGARDGDPEGTGT